MTKASQVGSTATPCSSRDAGGGSARLKVTSALVLLHAKGWGPPGPCPPRQPRRTDAHSMTDVTTWMRSAEALHTFPQQRQHCPPPNSPPSIPPPPPTVDTLQVTQSHFLQWSTLRCTAAPLDSTPTQHPPQMWAFWAGEGEERPGAKVGGAVDLVPDSP